MASAGGSSSDVGGAALPLNHQDGTAVQPEAPTSPLTVLDSISLSSEERALFDTLLAAARYAGGGTVLRAAGGWVRDKLLGHDSKDIDIALDNMLGRDFADKVNEFLLSQGKETRTAAVIQSNPDQSKHLETARMRVNDIWIDLVNLRSESYAEGSRIPSAIEFGTPLEDATRRDFTINALFYNLNDGTVEDFTGSGLDDLRAGVLRTPLPPAETFRDDPLRVLRAVRFATRFGFKPEADILQAAASDEVRAALASKVSRERIGTELEGMFHGAAPTAAVRLLHQLQLFSEVFALPPVLRGAHAGGDYGSPCVELMAIAERLVSELDLQLAHDERRLLFLAALLLPLRQLTYEAKPGKEAPASSYVVRESLKWRAKDADGVVAMHSAVGDLAEVLREMQSGTPDAAASELQVRLGRVMRALKEQWKLAAVLVPLLCLPQAALLGDELPSHTPRESAGAGATGADAVRALLAAAAGFGLDGCWSWKPLFNGKQLADVLGLAPGPALGAATAALLDWQLAHPGGAVTDAEAHLRALAADGSLATYSSHKR